MSEQEIFYTIALTRMTGFNSQQALQLYQSLGGAEAVYEHRHDVTTVLPDCPGRLAEALRHWDEALKRAAAEMEFIAKHNILALTLNDERYPARLRECSDPPVIVYYKGNADLNQRRVIDIVGTRRSTSYGQDLIHRFIGRLKELCPEVLIVSGLAYGIDICAHRQALATGFDTVGVLAHGLDTIYPGHHRDTAVQMVSHGGLLTEYMSQTEPFANNFRQRNRIVAGMSDATIVVESAHKGGALITARIAQEYNRDVFAFPGPVGAPYSEGCNHLIRDSKAGLITSADDFMAAMGWQPVQQAETVERQLFPSLTPEEQQVAQWLRQMGDLQLNMLSVKTNIPMGRLNALLFQMEMKGVIRAMAGGTYHLMN
jgi:DNA processing protein